MKLNRFVSAALFATATLTAPMAQAAFVNGSMSINGFYGNNTTAFGVPASIVSLLTSFDVQSLAGAGSANGDLALAAGSGTAFDFSILNTPVQLFSFGGFSFQVVDWGPVNNTPFTCVVNQDQCSDGIGFSALGIVTGNGYDATGFTMGWSSQGSCNESVASPGQCAAGASASWSASISATGTEPTFDIPEPGSLALTGLALLGLGLVRRKAA